MASLLVRPAPASGSTQQLVSLRAFHPRFSTHGRQVCPKSRRQARAKTAAADVADLLAGAQPLAPFPGDIIPLSEHVDQLPRYEHWHRHPELLQGCEPGAAPLQVAVLLSGGVDSSLALHLLKAAGHRVTAFYLQIWFQEDFRNTWDACPWEEDLEYCRAVCQRLGVNLQMVPLTEQYWDRVVAHCIGEIRQGRTPNPDVLCNSRVKFGAFYEYLEAQHRGTFDRVASGHYARLERPPAVAAGSTGSSDQGVRLALTPDAVKDQTYFLAHLSQRQLARTLFPLGHLTKPQVRALAAVADLPNKGRKDSQGICFLGKVKFSEFIKEHLGEWPGPIVEDETDEVVGYHRGFWFHTVGQRKGIPLSGGPWYVTRKHPDSNTVYISRHYHERAQLRNSFSCGSFNWCSTLRPDFGRPLYCKVRHAPTLYRCQLEMAEDGATVPPGGAQGSSEAGSGQQGGSSRHTDASSPVVTGQSGGHVVLDGNDQGLAAGQYAVFYQDSICLGSAVITGCDAC